MPMKLCCIAPDSRASTRVLPGASKRPAATSNKPYTTGPGFTAERAAGGTTKVDGAGDDAAPDAGADAAPPDASTAAEAAGEGAFCAHAPSAISSGAAHAMRESKRGR